MVRPNKEPEYTIPFSSNGSLGYVTIRVGIQPVETGEPNSMRVDFIRVSEKLPQDSVSKIRQELTEIVNDIVPSTDLVGFCRRAYDSQLRHRFSRHRIIN